MPKARPVVILTAAYAVLVFAVLGITPLWLDELQQLVAGRESIGALMRWVQQNPGASPLPYLVQRAFIDLCGGSLFVVRLPAALASIAGVPAFAAICRQLGIRRAVWATVLFLLLPLQFRYALEARGYSLGLFFALAALWLVLRPGAPLLYGTVVALGLYSQPLTILPALGGLVWLIIEPGVRGWTKREMIAAAGLAIVAYLPWYLLQHRAQQASGAMSLYFFSWRQITPLGLIHELSGGGDVCSLALLIGIAVAMAKSPARRLFACLAVPALVGPIIIDALVNYFFAARQFLFAAPVLALGAAAGIEWLFERHRYWAACSLLLAFAGASAVADVRLATVPKDSFGRQATSLANHLAEDACIAIAPPGHVVYYTYLQPSLKPKICPDEPTAARVIAVMSPYSTTAEKQALSLKLARNYDPVASYAARGIFEYHHR